MVKEGRQSELDFESLPTTDLVTLGLKSVKDIAGCKFDLGQLSFYEGSLFPKDIEAQTQTFHRLRLYEEEAKKIAEALNKRSDLAETIRIRVKEAITPGLVEHLEFEEKDRTYTATKSLKAKLGKIGVLFPEV
ncbi:hypothetical protein HZB97_03495 [Candidatus Gottesmanbacteria bacterium]|nr:hypothetical protein [Candidatus Gottesmanbacteria bacterium]